MTFFKNALQYMNQPHTRPLFYGMAFSWLLLATMACGKSPEEKAASKYLNPPKHH